MTTGVVRCEVTRVTCISNTSYGIVLNAWAEQITKPALNQAGINNFNNCAVLAIQLIVLVC